MVNVTWLHVLAAIGAVSIVGVLTLYFQSFIMAILVAALFAGVVFVVDRT